MNARDAADMDERDYQQPGPAVSALPSQALVVSDLGRTKFQPLNARGIDFSSQTKPNSAKFTSEQINDGLFSGF